jgi:hypothetical protein
VDAQDPLPESNWFYRRVFLFGLTIAAVIGCVWVIWPLRVLAYQGNRDAIMGVIDLPFYLLGVIVINTIFYTVAPSGEQVAKMFNLASLLSRGASWMTTSAAAAPGGGQVTVTTRAVGVPAATDAPGGGIGGISLNDDAPPPVASMAAMIGNLPWNQGNKS